ncbi:hypothetical protein MSMEI_1950 [Mycolicibacterium smegmatis MC2 155]|uniref:Uncharacterized protein n=1 Tax=Mycolicibacterium smegmatis (strain ATCC 700084 / mc(2)155) TaxID=246196 RepID=I7G5G7_MYCS2|nr:hypothetical protein MSMEI_1950 [Mycolicibacterium smegmatis MC2 155]
MWSCSTWSDARSWPQRLAPGESAEGSARSEVFGQQCARTADVLSHGFSGALGVTRAQLLDDRAVIVRRRLRPAFDRGEELPRGVGQCRLDQPADLPRPGQPVDGLVEPVIEPFDVVVVLARGGLLELGLDVLEFFHQLRGDHARGACRQLTAEQGLGVVDVTDVLAGQRRHRETLAGFDGEEALRLQQQQTLAGRCGADAEVVGHRLRPDELTGPKLTRHDEFTHVSRREITEPQRRCALAIGRGRRSHGLNIVNFL